MTNPQRLAMRNSVHVLGVGGIGGLVSYELSTIKNKPEITLLFRNKEKAEHFRTVHKSRVFLKRIFKDPAELVSSEFLSGTAADLKETIETLIVTTKTYQTRAALMPYLPFINSNTDILLIQNGLGVPEELYSHTWPTVEERPNLYQGVINHGAFISSSATSENYEVSHSGDADFFIGKVPRDLESHQIDEDAKCKPLFIQQLEDAEALKTTYLPFEDLLMIQLRKFVVNACINPNTSIIDCINGELSSIEEARSLFQDIISESMGIFMATIPALKNKPEAKKILDEKELLETVMRVGTVINKKNSSSMRQDVLNLRDTEIDYINGYVVTLAEKNGLKADINKAITKLVKVRLAINRNRA